MRRTLLTRVLAMWLAAFSAVALAHAETHEARDVSVRLFSTAPARGVELASASAAVRLCGSCAAEVLRSPVGISVSGDGAHLTAGGRTTDRVSAEGDVRITVEDGRSAHVAGRWSLSAAQDGLHIVVEVPSERYVMAVLQAEAAADEPAESLKALAVVVRSFAMQNPQRHGIEGLCDSTHCQALRFDAVPARVRAAVEATAGETLWFGAGSPRQVSAYFTQACGGTSEDAAALWGGERSPWLPTHPDPFCVRQPALWHAEFGLEQVRSALAGEGVPVPPLLAGVRVAQRDASGRVVRLALVSKEGDRAANEAGGNAPPGVEQRWSAGSAGRGSLAVSAAIFRFALNRAFGWNQLRSDAYRVGLKGGRLLFEGRGYGHGVGLCQAGARAAAQEGRSYRQILQFYFPGTSVRVLPGDTGWATRQANGWTLRATSLGNEWVSAGNAAWARARATFPVEHADMPLLTVFPTTELFRQGTGEPGWELAATRGTAVMLQPYAVIVRSSCQATFPTRAPGHPPARPGPGIDQSCVESLLLHELLHALVESEATARAPLWLREGLVEVLAGERCGRAIAGVADVDAALQRAGSMAESQRAHAAACMIVQRAVARYGLPSVRGWLRGGVPALVDAGQ